MSLSTWELSSYGLFLCLAVFVFIRHLISPRPIPGIPHRPITSILGDIPKFAEVKKEHGMVLVHFFEKYAKELGPLYQVLIGPSTMVVLSDIHEIEDLLLRRSKTLDASFKTTRVFGGVTPNGQIALQMNDLWKKHRRLGGPSMSAKYLKHICPRIGNGAQTLIGYWKEKMTLVRQRGGTCFDVSIDFQMCTMDAMAEIAFGEEHSGINEVQPVLSSLRCIIDTYGGATFPDIKGTSLHQAIFRHLVRINDAFNQPPFLLNAHWFFSRRSTVFQRDDVLIRGIVRSRIEQARKRASNVRETGGSETADCILDMIIEKETKEDGEMYKDSELIDEMMVYMLAGFDTTASALIFGIRLLIDNPRVQLKLHEELLSSLTEPEGGQVLYDDVATGDKTPYLEAFITEILRYAQVGAGMTRQLQEDVVVLGKHIPKGTDIMFLTGFGGLHATESWGASRASESSFKPTKGLWDDKDFEQFVPERWLVEGPDGKLVFSAKQGYSAPFGYGQKACFGQKLAMLEMKVILATLNLAFFFDKVPDELNGPGVVEIVTQRPEQCYVNLVDWEDYTLRGST